MTEHEFDQSTGTCVRCGALPGDPRDCRATEDGVESWAPEACDPATGNDPDL